MTEENAVVSTMPHPPDYFKLFWSTKRKGAVPAAELAAEDGVGTDAKCATSSSSSGGGGGGGFPLAPPPPPGDGETYTVFGTTYTNEFRIEDLLPKEKLLFLHGDAADTESASGRPGSGASCSRSSGTGASAVASDGMEYRREMQRLLGSIMANYRQLLDVLVRCPTLQGKKVDDLELLFVNFHSLLNRYRVHQAREQLAGRMRQQVAEERRMVARLESEMERAIAAIETAGRDLLLGCPAGGDDSGVRPAAAGADVAAAGAAADA
ncbi:unnamed protein product [Phaeothamnion confervicola]